MSTNRYLSEAQLRSLEALGIFKYLTTSRFIKLGVLKSKFGISRALKSLKEGKQPLVGEISFGLVAGFGRLEKVFYLTKAGAAFLVEQLNKNPAHIRYPAGHCLFRRDYMHRMSLIDFQISFFKWIARNGFGVLLFNTYFDTLKKSTSGGKGSFEASTKLPLGNGEYIIPDAESVFWANGSEIPINVEVCNGKEPGKIFKQLEKYILALSRGTPSLKHNLKIGSYIICVFEDEICKSSVMESFNKDSRYQPFKNNFLFKTADGIEKDFENDWELFDGQKVRFL